MRKISLRAMAPAVSGFQGLAFFRGGMIAAAPRSAMASWHLRVSKAPLAVTLAISCSGGIWSSSSGSMGASPTSLLVNSVAQISSRRRGNGPPGAVEEAASGCFWGWLGRAFFDDLSEQQHDDCRQFLQVHGDGSQEGLDFHVIDPSADSSGKSV